MAVFMGSDAPADFVAFYRTLEAGYDCVFVTRFSRVGRVVDYSGRKGLLNRLGNRFIQTLFRISSDDISNTFKMYRRTIIWGHPTVAVPALYFSSRASAEVDCARLPLRCCAQYLDQSRRGRVKFQNQRNGLAVFFIVLYTFLEQSLGRGDLGSSLQIRETQLQVWHR